MSGGHRALGPFTVSAIGLGCMNVSHAYGGRPDRRDALRLLAEAVELGITHFDTAALYGFGQNEELVGEALAPFRSRITLASKCGMTGINGKRVIDGRPETLRRTCEESLRRLRTDVIDLYYLHRWDKVVPIEESVGALADLVTQGKIRAVGLSEVSTSTLEKAVSVHPIAAVQSEYSLSSRGVEKSLLAACARLGTALVAFSPLCRGLLTGAVTEATAFAPGDIRLAMPRFQQPHLAANVALATMLRQVAAALDQTPAQVCLGWLLAKGPHVLPIPGTGRRQHLVDNAGAGSAPLPSWALARLETLFAVGAVSGDRYPPATLAEVDED
ncbi:aldo/keto reductase [Niveispirillum lacus]|uniref:Aldo/keto reductase n=1 Tax=Niveispirillum lacus TaxID=1981099 RepID=A0A255Z5C4_9PROT|nr:aldo/keto reductase [Niveispirillum lacus]OYQ36656.1 aldo/keto reductase [Niveispirillum lacus]